VHVSLQFPQNWGCLTLLISVFYRWDSKRVRQPKSVETCGNQRTDRLPNPDVSGNKSAVQQLNFRRFISFPIAFEFYSQNVAEPYFEAQLAMAPFVKMV